MDAKKSQHNLTCRKTKEHSSEAFGHSYPDPAHPACSYCGYVVAPVGTSDSVGQAAQECTGPISSIYIGSRLAFGFPRWFIFALLVPGLLISAFAVRHETSNLRKNRLRSPNSMR